MIVNRKFARTTVTFETEQEWETFHQFLKAADYYFSLPYKLEGKESRDMLEKLFYFKSLLK